MKDLLPIEFNGPDKSSPLYQRNLFGLTGSDYYESGATNMITELIGLITELSVGLVFFLICCCCIPLCYLYLLLGKERKVNQNLMMNPNSQMVVIGAGSPPNNNASAYIYPVAEVAATGVPVNSNTKTSATYF
jgi:hypothetical protein